MDARQIFGHTFSRPGTVRPLARRLGLSHTTVLRGLSEGGTILRFAHWFDALAEVAPVSALNLVEWLRGRIRPAGFVGTWSPIAVTSALLEIIKAEFERRPMRAMFEAYDNGIRALLPGREHYAELVRVDDERRAMAGGAA